MGTGKKILDKIKMTDFYKNLPPTSGVPIQERWSNRRVSDNFQDMTGPGFNREIDPMLNPAIVGTKSSKLPDQGPIPESKPKQTKTSKTTKTKSTRKVPFPQDRPMNSQNGTVTPGKWNTKNKI